ncbi:MAG: hypothetical protein E7051_06695 [Lentisphaerae bacterium]|nr:hypothetical protein [Lentisphaerota bacterium]
MKKVSAVMAIFAALLLCGAEEAKNHITGQFELLRAGKNTISNKDGIVTITLFQKLNSGGAREIFHLNQSKPVAIEFGAESKLDTGLDGKAGVDYCVYVDLVYADNSRTYQLIAPFSITAHDWELKTRKFVPRKPIKTVVFYLLYRNRDKGTVQFRNAFVREVPAK